MSKWIKHPIVYEISNYGETVYTGSKAELKQVFADVSERFPDEPPAWEAFEYATHNLYLMSPDEIEEWYEERMTPHAEGFMPDAACAIDCAMTTAKWQKVALEKLSIVLTLAECAELYGISHDMIRVTIHRGYINARKSGGTWLILREDAEKRWGNRKQS